ncbi:MAG: hypothetical protein DRO11_09735 [Methanobacteriota archaeon]|nr:MAG: hypothetical protein DRO11_09735 [Euryarchaeota archaeon]
MDNAGGVALALSLAKYFAEKPPLRTFMFVFFSGEELGLRGSRAFVDQHQKELDNIKLVVNLDVHGCVFGGINSIVTGDERLRHYIEALVDELGARMSVNEGVMSSDGTSLARAGVPVVNFARGGCGINIHTSLDISDYTHKIAFLVLGKLIVEFLERIGNAERLPFERRIPENLKKKVEKYFAERLGFDLTNNKRHNL